MQNLSKLSLVGLGLALAAAAATAQTPALAKRPAVVKRAAADASKDPLKIVISLNEQQLRLYRGDALLSSSRVSTGKRGHRTPRGVYSVIQKKRRHYSNLYRNAPMPYMQRITWSGIALHQGIVPGYPASHGCIRLPHRFARSLFRRTTLGASVIITRERQEPQQIAHRALFQQRKPALFPNTRPDPEALARWALPYFLSGGNLSAAGFYANAAAKPTPKPKLIEASVDRSTIGHFLDVGRDAMRGASSESEPKKDPVRVLILSSAKDTQVKSSQKILARLGYDVGDIDGLFGPQTAKAVRAFQTDKSLRKSGVLDAGTVKALYDAVGVKRPSGHLYVRRGRKDLFDTPIELLEPAERLGTHLFTAMDFKPARKRGETVTPRWTVLTIDDAQGAPRADAASALDRVVIPESARRRIEAMLTPGSSLIVSDADYGWETGQGTDFIVQPR